jgi:hypothetical protein
MVSSDCHHCRYPDRPFVTVEHGRYNLHWLPPVQTPPAADRRIRFLSEKVAARWPTANNIPTALTLTDVNHARQVNRKLLVAFKKHRIPRYR